MQRPSNLPIPKAQPTSEIGGTSQKLVQFVAFCTAVGALVWLTIARHKAPDSVTHLLALDPLKGPQFITPCLIFGLTISAYFHFITEFKGLIPGLSLIFSLIALILCLMLVESTTWWEHLCLLFSLFFSYVIWDILMLDLFLPKELAAADAATRRETAYRIEEVRVVSALINQPTLLTVFIVCLFTLCVHSMPVVDDKMLDKYVSGVVSFHLAFSSFAYVAMLTLYKPSRARIGPPSSELTDGVTDES